MLHRSFKAGKCRTSLKLAVARIKLLKNKREVQLRQMKRDLAQLLESGQEKTAMIRVEHVVREEKTMGAYDLIEIYCELIVARLPIIESQKNCPNDLKEAISSLIFASPRCADIPELLDVRKHFTTKYGKEFITSALELRPDCGVNRTVVEKLSARAPDGETKLKILTAISQEHNVEWDPKAFGEKELKPPGDLLNGPRVTETTSEKPVESVTDHRPTYIQKPESSYTKNTTGSSQNSRISDPTNITTNMTTHASMEPRTSGGATEGGEFERPSQSNRQYWNMEFKDATSAAQAAAESAERASMAARAAAELANLGKISRQYSTEPHEPFRYDGHGKSSSPRLKEEHIAKDSVKMVDDSSKSSFNGMDPMMQDRSRNKNNNMQGASDSMLDSHDISRSSNSASLRSTIAGSEQKADIYCQKCSSEVDAVDNNWQTKKPEEGDLQASQFGVESVNHHQHSMRTEHSNSREGSIRKQFSKSPSSSDDDNGNVNSSSDFQKYGDGGYHSSNMQGSTRQPSLNDYPPVVFDESISDDEYNLGGEDETIGRKYDLENLNTWIPGQHRVGSMEKKSSAHSHLVTESNSPSEVFGNIDKTVSPSQSGTLPPVTFDDSDGLNSGSEEEIDDVKLSGRIDSSNLPHQQNAFSKSLKLAETDKGIFSFPEETKGVNRKPWLDSSSDDSESNGTHHKRNQEAELNVGGESRKKYGLIDSPANNASPRHTKRSNNMVDDMHKSPSYSPVVEEKQRPLQSSRHSLIKEQKAGDNFVAPGSPDNMGDSEISIYSSSERGKLDLGGLRGGFRNKGYTRPPHRKGDVGISPPSRQQGTEDNPTITEQLMVVRTSSNSEALYQETYNRKSQVEVHKEINSRNAKTIFDSDSDDAEVLPRRTTGSRGYSGGRLSRRTRDSLAASDVNSVSPSTSGPEVPVSLDREKFSPQSSNVTETLPKHQSQTRSPGSRRNSLRTNKTAEQHSDPEPHLREEISKLPRVNISAEQQSSKPVPQRSDPQARLRGENSNSKLASVNVPVEKQPSKPVRQTGYSMHEGRRELSQSSSVAEQSSNPPLDSGSPETTKGSSLNQGPASRDNSLKKASHVHPKLPDYDTFTAHFESLRLSR